MRIEFEKQSQTNLSQDVTSIIFWESHKVGRFFSGSIYRVEENEKL